MLKHKISLKTHLTAFYIWPWGAIWTLNKIVIIGCFYIILIFLFEREII